MPGQDFPLSDDEDDYVDEIVSDEEDEKPTAGRLLRGSLALPNFAQFNMKHLHDLIHFGNVDLNPAYQRDVVWAESKMIGLIQSVFLNYYIPPVIFCVTQDGDDEVRTCIDGKQRCTSIINFMDGKIPFIPPNSREKYWYANYGGGRSGSQVPDTLKKRFDRVQMQAVEYRGLSDIQQRDIFQRVQMGVSLSASEKLQAIPGPWTMWIIELQKKYVLEEDTLGHLLTWDTSRAKAFQGLVAFIMMAYDPSRQTQPTYPAMTPFCQRSDPPDTNFKRRVETALALFVNIAQNHYATALGAVTQRVAPVEFWFICLLIYTKMGIMSIGKLAHHIGELRTWIRQRHVDVRANGRVMKDIHQFLSALPKKRDRNASPSAVDLEGGEVDPREERAAKRNRRAEEVDPTYRDTIVPRFNESEVATSTRAARPRVQEVPSARPLPSTSMDRPRANGSVNPYTAPSAPQFTPAQLAHFQLVAEHQRRMAGGR